MRTLGFGTPELDLFATLAYLGAGLAATLVAVGAVLDGLRPGHGIAIVPGRILAWLLGLGLLIAGAATWIHAWSIDYGHDLPDWGNGWLVPAALLISVTVLGLVRADRAGRLLDRIAIGGTGIALIVGLVALATTGDTLLLPFGLLVGGIAFFLPAAIAGRLLRYSAGGSPR